MNKTSGPSKDAADKLVKSLGRRMTKHPSFEGQSKSSVFKLQLGRTA